MPVCLDQALVGGVICQLILRTFANASYLECDL